ncbi:DMT family transporter [Thalassococcus lentus]|uniref:DMT family transporter n=1 Tax=Thalassococcus lentus TaxID=1210524 RepID=A0ABT4XNS8_9RHOB|nr:DMT family transporter [Thalassococcus lentus]MDA7423609.1 DMT family transporter [Thalassococcus lentus]
MSTPANGPKRETARGHLAMLGFSALVAGSFSLGSMAAPFIDPAVLNAVRFVIAGALLWLAAWATGGITREIKAAPWRYVALAALFAIYFVTMFEGLKTASPVSMAAVFTLNPALTAVFGYLVVRQVTTGWMAFAIAVGGVGALWVIFRADLTALLAFEIGRGETIYFWGCIGHALYAPLLRKLSRGEPALAFNAAILTAGAILLCLWAGPALVATEWNALPPIVWITIGYTAAVATSLTFLLLRFAALRLPSAKVMAYTYLTPSWVILWEIALGRGAPPALVLPGVALTALALLMLLRDR